MREISAVSPIPSPRTGDEARPSSTVRQRERERRPLPPPPSPFFLFGLPGFGWSPTTVGGVPSLLSLWIEMPASPENTFTETPRVTFHQIQGRPVTQSSWQIRWTITASVQRNSQEFRSWRQPDTGLKVSALYTLCGLLWAPLTSLRLSFLICKMERKENNAGAGREAGR